MIKNLLYTLLCLILTMASNKSEAINIISNKSTISTDTKKEIFITRTSPTNNATGINLDSKITIVFNESIILEHGTISIFNSDESIFEIFDRDSERIYIQDKKITIEPTNEFDEDSKYFIEISEDAIINFSGLETKTWSFTTVKQNIFKDIFQSQKPIFYPNPAINTIYFKNTERLSSIKIINLTGRCIIKLTHPFNSTNLSHLPKGMYFVNYFFSDGSMKTDKLLKK